MTSRAEPPTPERALPVIDLMVLAGGRGSRLGGALKPAVDVAGRTLLSRVLDARPLARQTVIVGPAAARPATEFAAKEGASAVIWALEDPPFGGPVAGIAAGLQALCPGSVPNGRPDWLLILACDLPWAADAARLLVHAASAPAPRPSAEPIDGFFLQDAAGRAQWLTGIYRPAPLRTAANRLGPAAYGASMHALLTGLRLEAIRDATGASTDVDTWQDVERSTALLRTQQDPKPPARP